MIQQSPGDLQRAAQLKNRTIGNGTQKLNNDRLVKYMVYKSTISFIIQRGTRCWPPRWMAAS